MLAVSVPIMDVSVPLVEMARVWTAIRLAIFRLGASRLWIEGDASWPPCEEGV